MRRNPVPQWQPDMQTSSQGSKDTTSNPLSSPPSTRFQSDYDPYIPLSPTPAVQSPKHGQRPIPISTDSFFSTLSSDSRYGNDTQNSHTALLGTFSAARPSSFPPTSDHYSHYPRISWLQFPWRTSKWTMYILYAVGIASAFSHHAFYSSLSGAEAQHQLLMLRYGAVLAYLTKTCLVSSVIWAFRQQIWDTFRRKLLSIAAIDSLFAAMEDLTAIINLEVFRNAKIAVFLAVVVW